MNFGKALVVVEGARAVVMDEAMVRHGVTRVCSQMRRRPFLTLSPSSQGSTAQKIHHALVRFTRSEGGR